VFSFTRNISHFQLSVLMTTRDWALQGAAADRRYCELRKRAAAMKEFWREPSPGREVKVR
jgi:hypothetical protein